MRIALLHPTYWPEVRRGSERLVHDLGVALAGRGHDVTLLTSHRHRTSVAVEDDVRVVRSWRPPQLRGLHLYEDHVANIPTAIWRLVRGHFDIAHALHPADAWAALQARRLGGPPYVLSVHGILNRKHLVRRRYRLEMLNAAVRGAAATSALSAVAVQPFRRYSFAEPVVLPGGVVCADYAGPVLRAERPTLLCPASLGDPRKRGALLLSAFELVRAELPEARLLLAGGPDPFASPDGVAAPEPQRLPEGAERVAPHGTDALARAYRSAWATVLPAIDEAFGLVLLESLASGTPVVAARSGACPEVVGTDSVGRLFEPDDEEDLARAMREALDLATRDETVQSCRAHASRYDWAAIVERYEVVYASALGVS